MRANEMTLTVSSKHMAFYIILLCVSVTVMSSGVRITCTSCQGLAASNCDAAPWKEQHSVPCNGSCITWRSLYATGRGLRTIWRGCDATLFPAVLSNSYRDTCGNGNFFVECTKTCSDHSFCNQNHTGIPSCWTCMGDHQSCDLPPPTNCDAPTTSTTIGTPPPIVECISCEGVEGGMCDAAPFRVTDFVRCNRTCVTRKTLLASDRSMVSVWRGCTDSLFPQLLGVAALDSCEITPDTDKVECTSTCSDYRCNKYQTGFTDCWTREGHRKSTCPLPEESDVPTQFQPDLLANTRQSPNTDSSSDLPPEILINCTHCEGPAGSRCDLEPNIIDMTVACNGSCATSRQLYTNGRKLRYIRRGCNETLSPNLLDERFRDQCQKGNFYVECNDLCRTGDRCNDNSTGIPRCWNCQGNPRSCDIKPEEVCSDPVPETSTRPPFDIQCISCTGQEGSSCDVTPHSEAKETCSTSCVSSRTFQLPNRTVSSIWRGCQSNLPTSVSINTCAEDTHGEEVVCSSNCYTRLCNKYSSGIPTCWSDRGELTPACERTTTEIPQGLLNPSRISTKKPYSIQDAYGGDNYRGEWKPKDDELNSTSSNTTKWKRNYKHEGPFFGQSYKGNSAVAVVNNFGLLMQIPFIMIANNVLL